MYHFHFKIKIRPKKIVKKIKKIFKKPKHNYYCDNYKKEIPDNNLSIDQIEPSDIDDHNTYGIEK